MVDQNMYMALYYMHEEASGHNRNTRSPNKRYGMPTMSCNICMPTYKSCNICMQLHQIENRMIKEEAEYYKRMEKEHNEQGTS